MKGSLVELKLSQQARNFEAHTWQQSFQSYVLEHRESLRIVGVGCRVDDEGNLVVPLRDLVGHIQGVRLLSKDGLSLDIGDLGSAGIVHVIDPGKRFGQGYAVFVTDYANAVAIQDATDVLVVVVSNERMLLATIRKIREKYKELKPVVAFGHSMDGGRRKARLGASIVVMPEKKDPRTIRSAFVDLLENLSGKSMTL